MGGLPIPNISSSTSWRQVPPNQNFATVADSYYAMKTYRGGYKREEFIICGTGAAFTYQWTHAFVDFRNLRDKLGRDWVANSRHAALAARQHAIDNAYRIKGLGENSWGVSASISPTSGYTGITVIIRPGSDMNFWKMVPWHPTELFHFFPLLRKHPFPP